MKQFSEKISFSKKFNWTESWMENLKNTGISPYKFNSFDNENFIKVMLLKLLFRGYSGGVVNDTTRSFE